MEMPELMSVLESGLAEGLHVGAQVHVKRAGDTVADFALGLARTHDNTPMTPDTLMLWLSAGKPITAAAVLILAERGRLSLDDQVVRHIPEFAGGKNGGGEGKETITIRHLLTHTSGIRGLDTSYPFATWEETLARIYDMKLERDWLPGQRAGYHIHTSWYILGELINRVTGTPHDQWIRQHLFLPLGMQNSWLAMDEATYTTCATRIGYLYDTTQTPPAPIKNYDTPLGASRPRPSASCRGPMRDLARFYEMLRNGGTLQGVRIMQPETVAAMTSRQRVGLHDQTFRATLDWGLGIILNSSHYGPAIPYQFGPDASPETFGHGGSQSSTGFCDPRHNLVVAMIFNGACGEAKHDKRLRAALKALYADLKLTPLPA